MNMDTTRSGITRLRPARLWARGSTPGLCWFVLMLVICLTSLTAGARAAPPNIVVIMADDMGWGDLHANNPQSRVPTPNLDRLANNGMRFTDAHTPAAMCAPTRYAALTGNYQWRGRRSWGTWQFHKSSQLLPGQLTIGDLLSAKGYHTAFVGKMHLGGSFFAIGSDRVSETPEEVDFARPFHDGLREHGFAYTFPLLEGIQEEPYAYFENDRLVGDAGQMRIWAKGAYGLSRIDNTGRGMPYWDSSKVGPDLAERAFAFITRHHGSFGAGRPFFLYYAAQAAHSPYTPPVSFMGTPVRGATNLCTRQDMIYELDVFVGKLEDHLRSLNLLANTLILFTSDNGGRDNCGHVSAGPIFRGIKGQVLEGGHRVPFIVKWGDGSSHAIPRGAVRHQPISVTDLTASLAAAAGVAIDPAQARDSFNFLPVWRGAVSDFKPVRDHLISESRTAVTGEDTPPTFAYRERGWKLIAQWNGVDYAAIGLFNLASDSLEQTNLLGTVGQASRTRNMLARFVARRNSERTAP